MKMSKMVVLSSHWKHVYNIWKWGGFGHPTRWIGRDDPFQKRVAPIGRASDGCGGLDVDKY